MSFVKKKCRSYKSRCVFVCIRYNEIKETHRYAGGCLKYLLVVRILCVLLYRSGSPGAVHPDFLVFIFFQCGVMAMKQLTGNSRMLIFYQISSGVDRSMETGGTGRLSLAGFIRSK